MTSGPLGVKSQRVFRIFSGRLGGVGWHVASRGSAWAVSAAWEVSAARSVGGSGRRGVGSVQKIGSFAAASGWA